MYEQFFQLRAEPFRLSPDHHFCYNHAQYSKAKAYMAYAFLRSEGFVMITGRPGTGKTTLMGDLIDSLADEKVMVGKLVSTQLAPDDLLRMVAFEFGIDAQAADKSTLLQGLTDLFRGYKREGVRALLIVDEAQDLVPGSLEELRLLTNLQQDGTPLLQIFLLGQPELREMVQRPEMEQVHQRILAASHMEPLQEPDTRAYVEFRLHVVGWANDPAISTAVFPIIFKFSEGIPRRINLICSRLFLHACVAREHRITLETARSVVAELQEEQLSTHNLLNDDIFYEEDRFEAPLTQDQLMLATNLRARHAPPSQSQQEEEQVTEPGPVADADEQIDVIAVAPEKEMEKRLPAEASIAVDPHVRAQRNRASRAAVAGSRRGARVVAAAVVAGLVLAAGAWIVWKQGIINFL